MATAYVAGFALAGRSSSLPGEIQVPGYPPVSEETVTFTSENASAAFSNTVRLVLIIPDADCFMTCALAGSHAATADSRPLNADTEYWIGVAPGFTVSLYDGVS